MKVYIVHITAMSANLTFLDTYKSTKKYNMSKQHGKVPKEKCIYIQWLSTSRQDINHTWSVQAKFLLFLFSMARPFSY